MWAAHQLMGKLDAVGLGSDSVGEQTQLIRGGGGLASRLLSPRFVGLGVSTYGDG